MGVHQVPPSGPCLHPPDAPVEAPVGWAAAILGRLYCLPLLASAAHPARGRCEPGVLAGCVVGHAGVGAQSEGPQALSAPRSCHPGRTCHREREPEAGVRTRGSPPGMGGCWPPLPEVGTHAGPAWLHPSARPRMGRLPGQPAVQLRPCPLQDTVLLRVPELLGSGGHCGRAVVRPWGRGWGWWGAGTRRGSGCGHYPAQPPRSSCWPQPGCFGHARVGTSLVPGCRLPSWRRPP